MELKAFSDSAKSIMDVLIHLMICVVVLVILVAPQWFPFLRHFAVRSGEVNIFGSKFQISQIDGLLPGLTIDGDRILLQGKDISALPDAIARLTSDNTELVQSSQRLSEHVKELESLIADLKKERDLANQQLATLSKTVPSAKPVSTGDTDRRIVQTENMATAPAPSVPPDQPPDGRASETYDFGIAIAASRTNDDALKEGDQAKKMVGTAVGYFQRERFIRSVVLFPNRVEATRALLRLRSKWKTAYVVDLRSWCPAATTSIQTATDASSPIDCRF